ncbi:uncharacterised protein family FPL [Kipferlia bialata]|uniref:FPL domain-containing protein n=1 Tax=Kipferlia bialata TaxID=797122 RepID=A0A9K3D366_9EUKA|nr:uncharacterised protein family FPL [Kipferlia bialata]|eukprot:g10526.t1
MAFRPRNKFSLEYLVWLERKLSKVGLQITSRNRKFVVTSLKEVTELLIWGDQNKKPHIFDFFLEQDMMNLFVGHVLNKTTPLQVKIQVVQSLSILFQNLKDERYLYSILSGRSINRLIEAPFDYASDIELLATFVSFLKVRSIGKYV